MTTKREAKMPYLVVSAEVFLHHLSDPPELSPSYLADIQIFYLSQFFGKQVFCITVKRKFFTTVYICILNGRPDRVGYWIATKEVMAYIDDLMIPANTLLKVKDSTALAVIMDIVVKPLEQYWRLLIDVELQCITVYSLKVFRARHGSREDG